MRDEPSFIGGYITWIFGSVNLMMSFGVDWEAATGGAEGGGLAVVGGTGLEALCCTGFCGADRFGGIGGTAPGGGTPLGVKDGGTNPGGGGNGGKPGGSGIPGTKPGGGGILKRDQIIESLGTDIRLTLEGTSENLVGAGH